jgi:hypothetical protein
MSGIVTRPWLQPHTSHVACPVVLVTGETSVSDAAALYNGATFMVTDLAGGIEADTEQGVFADDTRFVSYYAISANGVPWQRLTSVVTAYYAARFYLTNGAIATTSASARRRPRLPKAACRFRTSRGRRRDTADAPFVGYGPPKQMIL